MSLQAYQRAAEQAEGPKQTEYRLFGLVTRALMEAALERVGVGGHPIVEIMIPLTVTREELALARGKRTYDKRHDLAERDAAREVERAFRRRG